MERIKASKRMNRKRESSGVSDAELAKVRELLSEPPRGSIQIFDRFLQKMINTTT
jgi:hypothetical protein